MERAEESIAARLSVGAQSWELDETKWWILSRHWSEWGTQGRVMARFFASGGRFEPRELAPILELVDSLAKLEQQPLRVGVDKYPTSDGWHKRWRELLRAQPVAYESVTAKGAGVFRGTKNLSTRDPDARPDVHGALPPFRAVLDTLRTVVALARRDHAPLDVWLAQTYEAF